MHSYHQLKATLMPLGLTVAASATESSIQNKIYGSGMTTLIISNQEMKDMEIVKYLEESGLLNKGVSKKRTKMTKMCIY